MPRSANVLAFPDRLGDRLRSSVAPQKTYGDDEADVFGGKDPHSLTKLKKQYGDYLDHKAPENREMAEARRYYAGVQWDAEELQKLKDRNQPVVTFNRISRKINAVVGLIEKLRQDPKAYPRSPDQGAQDGAELATNVLMYACDVSGFKAISPEASRQAAIGGLAGVELVIVQGDMGDPDISLEPIDQREFFYDPRSTKAGFSDARYMGTSKWLDLDEAQDMWPDHEEELANYVERDVRGDATWRGDEREPIKWISSSRKRLRIVDHWYQKAGKWFYCIYCGEYKLEEGPSPFVDEKKKSIAKYFVFSCNVDHQNDRYGFYRDLKGPQDEINHRRSKALHLLNTRRVLAENGAFDDVEVARREMARADGMVLHNKGYEIEVDQAKEYQGNVDLLTEAKAEMDAYGPNPQLMGAQVQGLNPAASGRAIALVQQAGIAELGPFMLAWRQWKIRVYRALWNAVQQFWKEPRWIRVSDDQNLQQFIQINGWQQDEYGRPVVMNQVAALDVDIIIDEGPDQINSMADAFDTMMALAQQGAQIPPEAIIELSSLPSSVKKTVLGHLNQAQQDPMAQAATQLKMAQEQAKLGKTQSETQLNQAKAQQAMTPPEGPGQQIDTPADQAKAALDLAKARQLHVDAEHKAARGPFADDVQAHALEALRQLGSDTQHAAGVAQRVASDTQKASKTPQELANLAAQARLANAKADRLDAETSDPAAFHPRPGGA